MTRVVETSVYVDDLVRAETFYQEVLGLTLSSRIEGRHLFFRVGDGMLLVFDAHSTRSTGDLPPHGADGPGHFALAVDPGDWPAWRSHLAVHEVQIESEMEWGPGRSIYFRDPAGNSVELVDPAIWGMAPFASSEAPSKPTSTP